MAALFEVEADIRIAGREGVALVIARRLSDAELDIGATSMLGGRRVLHFDIPRALDAEGNQRPDVVGFIVDASEGQAFVAGQLVELSDA